MSGINAGINSAAHVAEDSVKHQSVQPVGLHAVQLATSPDDSMSFADAFASARREVGAGGVFEWRGGVYGTYYKEEWNRFTPEYRREFSNHDWRGHFDGMGHETSDGGVGSGVGHAADSALHAVDSDDSVHGVDFDNARMAASPDDSMSFADAFASARREVGAGGVFEWRGGVYNTYYKEEWNQLSPEYRREFSNHDWHGHHNDGHIMARAVPEDDETLGYPDDYGMIGDADEMDDIDSGNGIDDYISEGDTFHCDCGGLDDEVGGDIPGIDHPMNVFDDDML